MTTYVIIESGLGSMPYFNYHTATFTTFVKTNFSISSSETHMNAYKDTPPSLSDTHIIIHMLGFSD